MFIVVIEPAAGREIDASLGGIGNGHGSDEDLAAEQILVPHVSERIIVGEREDQGAHYGHAGTSGLKEERASIGD